MSDLRSSYLTFLLWQVVLTIVIGLVGLFTPAISSTFILAPYIFSFYLMTVHFLKKHQTVPNQKQRWQLSIGCATLFWLYSIITGLIGLMLVQGKLDFTALFYAFNNQVFVLFLTGFFLCVNAILVMLGYWFLGKPANKMLAHYQKH